MATAMVEDSNFEDDQLTSMTTDDIVRASRLLDNEIRILKVPIFSFSSLITCLIQFFLSLTLSLSFCLCITYDITILHSFGLFLSDFLCMIFFFLSGGVILVSAS